jgi:hypothetical protein
MRYLQLGDGAAQRPAVRTAVAFLHCGLKRGNLTTYTHAYLQEMLFKKCCLPSRAYRS